VVCFFSSRRRHTRSKRDWSSDVCSSDLNRARLLNKNTKDTRDHSRVFCYFKWFCPLSWKTESRANFDFAEYGFRYEKHNGQNKKDKGLRWRFFSAAF